MAKYPKIILTVGSAFALAVTGAAYVVRGALYPCDPYVADFIKEGLSKAVCKVLNCKPGC